MSEKKVVKEKKKVSNSGSKIYSPIDYYWDEESKCMCPKFGKILNRYEMIQAAKAKVDINDIIKRAQMGDISVLNMKHEIPLSDVSQIPDNINEAHQLNVNALNAWSQLSPEIREIFGNDIDAFATAAEDGSVNKIVVDALNKKKEDAAAAVQGGNE